MERTYFCINRRFDDLSYLLMMLSFPILLFPNFLLVDFSDVSALIVSLLYGPLAGILIEM